MSLVLRLGISVAAVFTVLVSLSPAIVQSAAVPTAVDAKIEIVYPHDAQGNLAPVASAPLVNVQVFLFQTGTLDPVACSFDNPVTLRWARNTVLADGQASQTPDGDEPGLPASATGVKVTRTLDGEVFPAWEFDNIPVSYPKPGADPRLSKTFFLVQVAGVDTRTNVWSHGADPRTFFPDQVSPSAVTSTTPDAVDAVIQVVFPHDANGDLQPVTTAPLANVAVDVLQHPLGPAVSLGFNQPVHLLQSLNDGYLTDVGAPQEITRLVGGLGYPRWEFNNIDVSAAENPSNTYFFAASVDGVTSYTTIWAHGDDSRTIHPQVDVPTSGGAGCS
jgi:hypothetical protein